MPLTSAALHTVSTTFFTDAADIDNFFIKTGGEDFVSWFNAHAAGKENWGRVGARAALSIATDTHAHDRFNQLWSNESMQAVFGTGKISLLQFVALQSIIINETGGRLIPLTEGVGSAGHPGIAYAFDKIPGLKKSYNTLSSNKTCLQNFNDPNYNKAFSGLPLADQLKNTTNPVWSGEVYPQPNFPSSTNPAISGYVLEADFFKFRGRGFIQTTGRTNYSKLISYITGYTGANQFLTGMKAQWNNLSADDNALASMSSNSNWDDLFQKSDCLVAGKAINIHNESCGNYLQVLNASDLNTLTKSVFNVGLRISGANNYATLYQNRVLQVLGLL